MKPSLENWTSTRPYGITGPLLSSEIKGILCLFRGMDHRMGSAAIDTYPINQK